MLLFATNDKPVIATAVHVLIMISSFNEQISRAAGDSAGPRFRLTVARSPPHPVPGLLATARAASTPRRIAPTAVRTWPRRRNTRSSLAHAASRTPIDLIT